MTTQAQGPDWTITAVEKLQQLWSEGVPVDRICQTLGRPEEMVRAKASELKLPGQPVGP